MKYTVWALSLLKFILYMHKYIERSLQNQDDTPNATPCALYIEINFPSMFILALLFCFSSNLLSDISSISMARIVKLNEWNCYLSPRHKSDQILQLMASKVKFSISSEVQSSIKRLCVAVFALVAAVEFLIHLGVSNNEWTTMFVHVVSVIVFFLSIALDCMGYVHQLSVLRDLKKVQSILLRCGSGSGGGLAALANLDMPLFETLATLLDVPTAQISNNSNSTSSNEHSCTVVTSKEEAAISLSTLAADLRAVEVALIERSSGVMALGASVAASPSSQSAAGGVSREVKRRHKKMVRAAERNVNKLCCLIATKALVVLGHSLTPLYHLTQCALRWVVASPELQRSLFSLHFYCDVLDFYMDSAPWTAAARRWSSVLSALGLALVAAVYLVIAVTDHSTATNASTVTSSKQQKRKGKTVSAQTQTSTSGSSNTAVLGEISLLLGVVVYLSVVAWFYCDILLSSFSR